MTSSIDALGIRRRLGRQEWRPPREWGDGWYFDRYDTTRRILVSVELMDGEEVLHASISCGRLHLSDPAALPTYHDLVVMHRGVWGGRGYAYQVFAPEESHINIREDVLHLWGGLDGRPIDMARVAAYVDEIGTI